VLSTTAGTSRRAALRIVWVSFQAAARDLVEEQVAVMAERFVGGSVAEVRLGVSFC